MSNPKTEQEVLKDFLTKLHVLSEYWAKQEGTKQDVCDGLVFSILNIFDGTSIDFPAMDIVLRPHPDDKEYHKSCGEDWFKDGMVINDCELHGMYIRNEIE